MKTKTIVIRSILVVFLMQLFFMNAFCQTLTETFDNKNFKTTPSRGSFTGVGGTVWTYTETCKRSDGYKQMNSGDTNYAVFNVAAGSISALFTKKISQVSFKARGWNTVDAEYEVFINNQSKGTLVFPAMVNPPVPAKSLSFTTGCDTNLLTIRLIKASGYGTLDDLSVTFDTLLPDDPICISPYVTKIHSSFGSNPKNELTISWETPLGDTNSYVLYGETTSYGNKFSGPTELVTVNNVDCVYTHVSVLMHHMKLTGLNPGTEYHYRCGGSKGLSGDCKFRTAPAGTQPYTFAVLADIQGGMGYSSEMANCAKFMKEQNLSFFIPLGDLMNNGGSLHQWDALFASGSFAFENIVVMPTLGNHESYYYKLPPDSYVMPEGTTQYLGIFRMPYNGSPANKNLWYAFEYSNSVFTSMFLRNMAIQKSWMDSVYKNSSKLWKLASWHTCPYSTGPAGGGDIATELPTFLAVTDSNNVATVFNGHSHTYQFTHPVSKVGNPPTLSTVTINGKKAVANRSQGTVFYNGAGINGSSKIDSHSPSQPFTLTGDSTGNDRTILMGTVYGDSIVYKTVYYQDCKGYLKGDVLFTYTIINDTPGTQYTLTVNSGTGSGNYNAAASVVITANAPATGKLFDKWTGDVTNVANINAASTTIAMPASNAAVTATYKDAPASFTLTVTGGTGSGSYAASAVVNIVANAPAAGKVFDKWTGDISGVANVNSSSTTITMPAANAAITATYKDAPPNTYTLTVSAGIGSGNYTAGTVVNISANPAGTGKIFDKWTGSTTGIANVNSASTTITMPAANINIAASYKDVINSLNENNDGLISIYPNPAVTHINIYSDLPVDIIEITDLSGKMIYQKNMEGSHSVTFPVDNCGKGLFVVSIVFTNGDRKYRLFSVQ